MLQANRMAVPSSKKRHRHHRDIVVIGASAGGVSALLELVKTLPADFPAPIFIVQHIAADSPSILPQLLSSVSALKARRPQNGETPAFLEPGRCRLLRAVSGMRLYSVLAKPEIAPASYLTTCQSRVRAVSKSVCGSVRCRGGACLRPSLSGYC